MPTMSETMSRTLRSRMARAFHMAQGRNFILPQRAAGWYRGCTVVRGFHQNSLLPGFATAVACAAHPRGHNVNRVILRRCSGILLHVTSLPGGHGIGDLGNSAHEFVEFLAHSGQKIWQVLPLSPTGYGDLPYQCFSAFAGNPLLIDLRALREQGLLSLQDLSNVPDLPEEQVEYGRVIDLKQGLLRKAAHTFLADGAPTDRGAFDIFCQNNADWLDDYALFMACKKICKDAVWT